MIPQPDVFDQLDLDARASGANVIRDRFPVRQSHTPETGHTQLPNWWLPIIIPLGRDATFMAMAICHEFNFRRIKLERHEKRGFFRLTKPYLDKIGITDPHIKRRGLHELAKAGLIELQTHRGRSALVRVLTHKEFKHRH